MVLLSQRKTLLQRKFKMYLKITQKKLLTLQIPKRFPLRMPKRFMLIAALLIPPFSMMLLVLEKINLYPALAQQPHEKLRFLAIRYIHFLML
jgi:hypothetical protein